MGVPITDVEDALQGAWLTIYERYPNALLGEQNVRGLLWVLAWRLVLDRRRSPAHREQPSPEQALAVAAQVERELEDTVLAEELLKQADERTRQILSMWLAGYSFLEIAAEFGISEQRAKQIKYEFLQEQRRLFGRTAKATEDQTR